MMAEKVKRNGNKEIEAAAIVVFKYAVTSRCLIILLIILWRTLIPSYDTSSSINPPCIIPHSYLSAPNPALTLSRIGSAIQNSVVWDSVYFVRIAECGYEYEQSYAFLPLLPLLIKFFARTALSPLISLIGYRAVLALAGYIISNTAFVVAAVYFYRLSMIVLKDQEAAHRASILFCFNPASVFYSSIYSESLYALCFIGGLQHFLSGEPTIATFWWSISAFTRSNGIINAGYFCHHVLLQLCDNFPRRNRVSVAVKVLVLGALRCLCIFAPFFGFQTYGYYRICHARSSDESSPWCGRKIPLLYNYIQSKYWGVGFLRYYELKQLPNFLLASPVLSLATCAIIHFGLKDPEAFFKLGLRTQKEESFEGSNSYYMKKSSGSVLRYKNHLIKENAEDLVKKPSDDNRIDQTTRRLVYDSAIVSCTYHLGFMVATALLVMHVQVSTRFLSASPPVYWYAATVVRRSENLRLAYVIWAYCSTYILLGSLLFSTFYPFT